MFFSFTIAMIVRHSIFGISPAEYAFTGLGIMLAMICLLLINFALASETKE